ncbi:PPR: pentatricopeptide repeat domain containing protein [Nitzschia inconspicua]|uniref:PPR: pentatricopeptide repeat domain containing protein n=1 Tax=Nitzschia inconspicua TaxID=303405 RepID=A0A9K3LNV7_9STRA|nr:PPR: pentatricopeptide repeat domain containing protein [Nitzschia inconspicua]
MLSRRGRVLATFRTKSCARSITAKSPSFESGTSSGCCSVHEIRSFWQQQQLPGKRRYFSDLSDVESNNDSIDYSRYNGNYQPSRRRNNNRTTPPPEVALDKFTHYCLNPNMVPLGTMTPGSWKDMMEAIESWVTDDNIPKTGYAVDSASRLLDRLWVEYYSTTSAVANGIRQQQRYERLVGLQRLVFHAWIDCSFSDQMLNSSLALFKVEHAFWQLSELLRHDTDEPFPIDEYTALIEACLSVDGKSNDLAAQERGAEKAADLLMKVFSTNRLVQFDAANDLLAFAPQISPLFERCVVKVLKSNSKNPIAIDLLELMSELKQREGGWSSLTLPSEAERILLESSLQKSENEQHELQTATMPNQTAAKVSAFEREAIEKRLMDLLQKAGTQERDDDLERLIDRTTKVDPSGTLVTALIEYYIRLGDVEKSSFWLQRLDDTSLKDNAKVVEKVMVLWSKEQGQRIPWRADELLKSITGRLQNPQTGKVPIDSSCIKIIIDMWASSGDKGADRKILDWFSSMVAWSIQLDGATLRTVLRSVQKENALSMLELVSLEILEQWKSLGYDDKVWLAEEAMSASASIGGETSDTVSKLLDRFRDDDIKPTPSVYHSALRAIQPASGSPADILKLVGSFESNLPEIDLSLYTTAVHSLFQFEHRSGEIDLVCNNALQYIQSKTDGTNAESISQFLENVVRMHTSRKDYSAAGAFIKNSERVLLPSPTDDVTSKACLIPLECYKLMIVRKWYTDKTAPAVKRTFEHLINLFRSGYETLRPDSETYTGYLRACVALGEHVAASFDELVDLYKSTGDETLKPTTETFNVVLLSYSRQNIKKTRAGNKSVKLIELMIDLGVAPDTKSLNSALHNLTKATSKYSFEMATKLLENLEKNNCLPEFDSFTLHLILDACGGDGTTKSDVALKKCLSTFREIREKDMIGPTTYGILSKVLDRLLAKGDRADKVAGSILGLCCQDGRLTNEVRDRLRSILSKPAWILHYERNLGPNGEEPHEWSSNVLNESDSEDAA